MTTSNTINFNGKAGGYFLVFLVTLIFSYIPFFGWAFALNYAAGWVMDNTTVNGKALKYSAGYGEALMFIFVNTLLLIITFGIYIFWFVPKMYRFIVGHTDFAGAAPVAKAEAPAAPAAPKAQATEATKPTSKATASNSKTLVQ